jgi:N-carbamoylputrescine amidase
MPHVGSTGSAGRVVTVAAVQTSRRVGDVAHNRERGVAAARAAASEGASIIALPELFTTEYFPATASDSFFEYAETIPGETTDAMSTVAAEYGVHIIAPIFEYDPSARLFYNAAPVIGPSGVIGLYRKRHIPSTPYGLEKQYFTPGNLGYPVFDTPDARIGILICYDRHFPEAFRHLAYQGAEIVFICVNSMTDFSKRNWSMEARTNAMCNGVFIVQTNPVGQEGPTRLFGQTMVVDPRGNVVDELDDTEERTLLAKLDLDAIVRARMQYNVIRDMDPQDLGLNPELAGVAAAPRLDRRQSFAK